MTTARFHFESWGSAWRQFWRELWHEFSTAFAPACARPDCQHTRSLWRRFRRKSRGVVIEGLRYCREDCMEQALTDALRRRRSVSQSAQAPHRVPLGLVLLSRQELTAEQLQAGLAAQRSAGRGKIGEWLQTLGFASEQQVTSALARQWSCPVWRPSTLHAEAFLYPRVSLHPEVSNQGSSKSASSKLGSSKPGSSKPGSSKLGSRNSGSTKSGPLKSGFSKPGASRAPQIPRTLLEAFVMIPVDYVESKATLHIAFSEGIDYSLLYAIEQMVGCRTESCLAVPSFVRRHLQARSLARVESEVVFDRVADGGEFSRIVRSYSVRLAATELRLAVCGPYSWVRLLCPTRPPLDLMLGSARDASTHISLCRPA
jgi:hypothetical protein